ncbi:MAG: hypothetical protein AB7K86_05210 [Rhodospirillales bacterium]
MSTIWTYRITGTFLVLSSQDSATGLSLPAAEAQLQGLLGNGSLAGFLTVDTFAQSTPAGNDGLSFNAVIRASASVGSLFAAIPRDTLPETFLFDAPTLDTLQITTGNTGAVIGSSFGSFTPSKAEFTMTDQAHTLLNFAGVQGGPLAQFIPDNVNSFSSKQLVLTWSSGTQSVSATFEMNIPSLVEPTGSQTPTYRFYNTLNGVHVYTSSEVERDDILFDLPQYIFEGPVFGTPASSDANAVAVYRFFNGNVPGGAHFYTTSVAERDQIVANAGNNAYLANMHLEGIGLYAYDHMVAGASAVYRFFNGNVPGGGAHFYTSSQSEYQQIVDNPNHDPYLANLQFELIAYYVLAV